MFLPGRNAEQENAIKKQAFKRIEAWCEAELPEAVRPGCMISVQEIQCGDPQCAPIDTAITLVFTSGQQGMFGVPMEAQEVTEKEIKNSFPTPDVIEKWHKGEDAEWPPDEPIALRFHIGMFVLCRVGPTDWAPGKVIQLWYREPNWPQGSFAPYKIKLDDGREIYAPADMEQIIRVDSSKEQPPPPAE